MNLELKAYNKHRFKQEHYENGVPTSCIPTYWSNTNFWYKINCQLSPTPRLYNKYIGYAVFSKTFVAPIYDAFPYEAMIMTRFTEQNTIGVHKILPPLPTIRVNSPNLSGISMFHTNSENTLSNDQQALYDRLPEKIWRQVGRKKDDILLLIKFRKKKTPDTTCHRDTATGNIHLYYVECVLGLQNLTSLKRVKKWCEKHPVALVREGDTNAVLIQTKTTFRTIEWQVSTTLKETIDIIDEYRIKLKKHNLQSDNICYDKISYDETCDICKGEFGVDTGCMTWHLSQTKKEINVNICSDCFNKNVEYKESQEKIHINAGELQGVWNVIKIKS